MNDDHAGSELCRLDQHLDSFLRILSLLLAVYLGSFNALRLPFALHASGVKTAPEHRSLDPLDTDHQGGQSHVHLFPLAHIEHLAEGPDQDVS
jgi:hypothetical protein